MGAVGQVGAPLHLPGQESEAPAVLWEEGASEEGSLEGTKEAARETWSL